MIMKCEVNVKQIVNLVILARLYKIRIDLIQAWTVRFWDQKIKIKPVKRTEWQDCVCTQWVLTKMQKTNFKL